MLRITKAKLHALKIKKKITLKVIPADISDVPEVTTGEVRFSLQNVKNKTS